MATAATSATSDMKSPLPTALPVHTGPNPNPRLNKPTVHALPSALSAKYEFLKGPLTPTQNSAALREKYYFLVDLAALPVIFGLGLLILKKTSFTLLGKVIIGYGGFLILSALYALYNVWKTPDIFTAIPGKYNLMKKAVEDARQAGTLAKLLTTKFENKTPLEKASKVIAATLNSEQSHLRDSVFLDPIAAEYLRLVSSNPTIHQPPQS